MDDQPQRRDDEPDDPFAAMLSGLGVGGAGGMADLGAMLQRLGAALSAAEDDAVPWSLVTQSADEALRAEPQDLPTDADAQRFGDAGRLADTWLDEATAFPATGTALEVWSRREWIERTGPRWRSLVDPLASRAGEALGPGGIAAMPGAPPELEAMLAGPLGRMVRSMGSVMFAGQLGTGLAQLSGEVTSTADVAVPVSDDAAVVVPGARTFGVGLGLSDADVALHLSLRAHAHARLSRHAPWLLPAFVAAVDEYARGATVDVSAIEESMRGLDPSDPAALQRAVESGMFEPPTTPEQVAAQARIETLVALVEGWLDDVVGQAGARMPSAGALRESVQRRRATGSPTEQTFAALVGLELRPRRLREASALWARIREERGIDGRDALWGHPDLLPSSDDLDDPTAFLSAGALDLAGLEDLPSIGDGDAPPADPPSQDG